MSEQPNPIRTPHERPVVCSIGIQEFEAGLGTFYSIVAEFEATEGGHSNNIPMETHRLLDQRSALCFAVFINEKISLELERSLYEERTAEPRRRLMACANELFGEATGNWAC